LLLTAVQTGLRVNELTGLNCGDLTLGTGATVRCLGKGRRHRAVPLTATAEAVLRVWVSERAGQTDDPLFPPAPAGASALTPFNASSASTPPRQQRRAHRYDPVRSIPMCCVTPAP